MTKGTIGMNAGTILTLLEENSNEHISFDKLKRETSLSDENLWSAIGWLARENKIKIKGSLPSLTFCQGTNFHY